VSDELQRVEEIAHGAVDRLCAYDAWDAPGDFGATADRVADFLGIFVRTAAVRLAGVSSQGDAPAPMSAEEAAAIADCISVTQRMGTSYECYGGVEVNQASALAQQALERFAPNAAETQVEDRRV